MKDVYHLLQTRVELLDRRVDACFAKWPRGPVCFYRHVTSVRTAS